ncbi:RNA methyltransferase, RsmE family [Thioflavicoccus mobilis 8321]|uniref:Ribosomal RNA small subunit methyltransferase E n=1 Tax=Thioflavicoccus mobilis 8321 TaxID=765912 RepID=L0GVK5_9GAMM|nr:16S rRNA (uracil(1498)-N(3))-methyltransferase [Thioflavicoccus mobilis]AGA89872.1 RNA methyltransferase, RsmE family [Thioflavicoccus mobilis 8321]
MREARIYVDTPLAPGQRVRLPAGPTQHLVGVLRLAAGAELILFNGDGIDYRARLLDANRRGATAAIGEAGEIEPPPTLRLHLGIGISKGERFDFALQKAVELGVTEIHPLFTERTVVRLDAARLAKRLQHWSAIVIAACEQSGRRRLPRLAEAGRLSDWLAQHQPGGLLLDPRAEHALSDLPAPSGTLTLLVGPEGGLSEKERATARAHGFTGVRLGPRVLRTETAPLAAMAAIQALWGDFRAVPV